MLIPITCTCGRSLGDIYDAFIAKKKKMIESKFQKDGIDVNPDKLQDMSGDDIFPELGELLTNYHITMTCCRRILLTSVNFVDLSNKSYISGQPQE